MATVKPFARNDFEHLLESFLDENQFPWLDPSLHERYFTDRIHSIDNHPTDLDN